MSEACLEVDSTSSTAGVSARICQASPEFPYSWETKCTELNLNPVKCASQTTSTRLLVDLCSTFSTPAAPLRKKFHSGSEMSPACLMISTQSMKEKTTLCCSNRPLQERARTYHQTTELL